MLATKAVTVRIDNETLDRFEKLAQKAQKSAFGTFSTDSIQDFLRKLLKNELDRMETKVANSSKV
ncbi:hypothetical protein ACT54M_18165 [Leptospira santarosai]|uniref:Uncharacterized protein n=1 Tax=Leptospira santarosai str. ZUN179 TaxID=1049985 RepID=M6UP91_9LEPT|nr:hypothetical protein [Leptospira santarosai]EMO44601.1 hypothetical protein LEP1GSC187_0260 [Leptospira santarosai str. ZUN179]OLY58676.1 hypothetical protein BV917_20155 [Leptospira santarosai serovar Guaricura]